jgi:hypothetical protein
VLEKQKPEPKILEPPPHPSPELPIAPQEVPRRTTNGDSSDEELSTGREVVLSVSPTCHLRIENLQRRVHADQHKLEFEKYGKMVSWNFCRACATGWISYQDVREATYAMNTKMGKGSSLKVQYEKEAFDMAKHVSELSSLSPSFFFGSSQRGFVQDCPKREKRQESTGPRQSAPHKRRKHG